ncbi:MAG: hypothetical protein ABSD64_08790 [Terriglobales bacterium]|jgi:hypothetical protein
MRSHKLPHLRFVALALVLFAPQVLLAQYAISTVAGGGPNNVTALSASIGYPGSVTLDTAGNTYIADSYSSHIFKVDTTGNLTVVAGNGTRGYSGDGGSATSAALNGPEGVFVDGQGNIFIADTANCLIREVSSGNISTVAGSSALSQPCGYAGDGGPATSALLNDPYGVFVDGSGNIFIADTDNCLIREVSGGNISTVAGNPLASPSPCGYSGDGGLAASAQLDEPEGVFVVSGNIFIADTDNNLIRVVNTGTAASTIAGVTIPPNDIQTVAGTYYQSEDGSSCGFAGDGGPALNAQLCLPDAVLVDSLGDIFIADTDNFAVREVAASGVNIATVAGTLGQEGYSGDGGAATSAFLNYPSSIFVDGSGDIFIADTDNSAIREVTASNSNIQSIIGDGTLAYSGDGGSATNAELNFPGGVFVDGSGNIFIADSDSSVIREVVAITGDIQTVAGDALLLPGYSGDGGPATSAQLNSPEGVFVDSLGNIFIADTNNSVIREVVASTGDIQTVAGNFNLGAGYSGDGGLATNAQLSGPSGVFVDTAEDIFIADTSNSAIREVTASSGDIATVAGNGTECNPPGSTCGDGGVATSAQLGFPASVFVDASENIYIADTFDNRVRVVANPNNPAVTIAGVVIPPGDIATVAGTGARGYAGDGAASTNAELDTPYGVFVDLSGDIFIADTDNAAIREVVAATGFIQTVAGTPLTRGFSGDGGESTSAELNLPSGLAGNSAGTLFIADTDNERIRELVPSIFVTVTPNPVNVAVGTQQQFTATVTGTSNTSVTWQVNGVVGGNSTVGTISISGVFQAPATIPTPATVTITAMSDADNTTSGSSQATIVPAGDAVNVTVSTNPLITEVYTTTTQTFIATVTGTSNTAVTWQVDGVTGGNSTVGTIDAAGNYTGPAVVPTPATVTVEAVSQALSSAIGAESFLIVTDPSAAEPAPQTTTPGGAATYSLLLNENTGAPGQPITLACLQSTLPPNATCSFAPRTITPGPQAVAFSLTITVPTGSASVENPSRTRLLFYCAFVPLAGILLVGAGRRNGQQSKRRYWPWLAGLCVFLILLNACGGSSSTSRNPELGTYNVKVQGTTSAQPNPVTITIAGLTVQ